ncbi:MAG: hypothetical protein D6812_16855, partial [Deltaproteobacteria bacterium]
MICKMGIVALVMKKIFGEEGLRKALPGIFEMGAHLFTKGAGLRFLESVIRYLYENVEIEPQEIVEALRPVSREGREIAMSTAEKLIEQGKLEGLRAGKLEGLHEGEIKGKLEGLREGKLEGQIEALR